MSVDWDGHSIKPTTVAIDDGAGRRAYRDVTVEVNNALRNEIDMAISYCNKSFVLRASIFYEMVDYNCPWDIKEETPWTDTIDTEYPGKGATVIYCGLIMTLEDLGNYTYGCLGRVYGFDLSTLFYGSEFAAGFPQYGTEEWAHETLHDQFYVELGYYYGLRMVFNP